MGHDLMKAALLMPDLRVTPRARLVLIRMALTALDGEGKDGRPPRVYYGGWEPLALCLGHDLPSDYDLSESADRRRRNAYEAVRVAIADLVASGALTRLNRAVKGTRQTYRLNLGPGMLKIRRPDDPDQEIAGAVAQEMFGAEHA